MRFTPNPPTNIVNFQGVWLEHNLNLKGWNSHVPRDFLGVLPESLSQAMLVGTMLVGRLNVIEYCPRRSIRCHPNLMKEINNANNHSNNNYVCIYIYI